MELDGKDKSLMEIHTKRSLPFKLFHPFGCEAWRHIPKLQRSKFDPKAERCIHLGIAPNHQAFRLLHIRDNMILISRDVSFWDNVFPRKNPELSIAGENEELSQSHSDSKEEESDDEYEEVSPQDEINEEYVKEPQEGQINRSTYNQDGHLATFEKEVESV